MKAISADIYSNARYRGCSAGGISERFDEVLIPHPRGPIDIIGDEPNLCRVIRRELFDKVVFHLEPVKDPGCGWYASGGSYVACCDSRFSELFGNQYGAISLHDRLEK